MIKENYKNIEGAYIFDSWKVWKIITIFGGIHWDEISWVKASMKLITKLESNNIILNFWKIIIVPKCNKLAVDKWERYIKYNLNRLFFNWNKWDSYEEKRSEELMCILKQSDYLLDLHSTSWPSIPFLFSEMENMDLAKKLGISHIIWWWWELWNSIVWGDTENYIIKQWWIWFTFEAWNHDNINWVDNAYNMILNFISVLWWILNNNIEKIWIWNNVLKVDSVYISKSNKFKYLIPIENFTKILKWTLIWIDDWIKIYAENDMILVMAKKESLVEKWVEVFFIWKRVI